MPSTVTANGATSPANGPQLFGDSRESDRANSSATVRERAFTVPATRVARQVRASGGALFLDESVMPPLGLQTRLLRVLAEDVMAGGEAHRSGVDLHVVCATHRDLGIMVAQGCSGGSVVPPQCRDFPPASLRERSDILALMMNILDDEVPLGAPHVSVQEVEQRLLATTGQ